MGADPRFLVSGNFISVNLLSTHICLSRCKFVYCCLVLLEETFPGQIGWSLFNMRQCSMVTTVQDRAIVFMMVVVVDVLENLFHFFSVHLFC